MISAVAGRLADGLGFLPGWPLVGINGLERVLAGIGHERRADRPGRIDVITVDVNILADAPAPASHDPDPAVCHPRRPQPPRAEQIMLCFRRGEQMLWVADYNPRLRYGSKKGRRGNPGAGRLTVSSDRELMSLDPIAHILGGAP